MLFELQAVKEIVKALRNKKWKSYCQNRFIKGMVKKLNTRLVRTLSELYVEHTLTCVQATPSGIRQVMATHSVTPKQTHIAKSTTSSLVKTC